MTYDIEVGLEGSLSYKRKNLPGAQGVTKFNWLALKLQLLNFGHFQNAFFENVLSIVTLVCRRVFVYKFTHEASRELLELISKDSLDFQIVRFLFWISQILSHWRNFDGPRIWVILWIFFFNFINFKIFEFWTMK